MTAVLECRGLAAGYGDLAVLRDVDVLLGELDAVKDERNQAADEVVMVAAQVDDLYVVGMKSQFCIDSTCRSAADLGFKPLLVADAHTCMDTAELSAEAIIKHHNATLGAAFARLVDSAEVTF